MLEQFVARIGFPKHRFASLGLQIFGGGDVCLRLIAVPRHTVLYLWLKHRSWMPQSLSAVSLR